ncbi:MAG: patatin-like phospholipase family protein [Cyanobacteriota bacterium]|nr:patatin-like phospholipase family protein [Cyanobacteriota bacterium]
MTEHKASLQQHQQELRGGLGLSFSGGGFRATAFSLGTLTLLQDLGLLAQAKVMSSVSGGSLAQGTYLCAKAGSGAQKEADFDFDGLFYQPLMRFLGEERLAVAFVNAKELVGGGKLILKAAQATQIFFNERLEAGGASAEKGAVFGNPKITAMLANDNLSPDYVFFNATNITSLDLFRFGIQRGSKKGESMGGKEPVFVLNRYFLKHNRESAEGKALYQFAQDLRIADCVAASFGFPAGFEPLLFPDDFIEKEEVRQHFRGDLICDHKPYLAFLDGGLYDNLGLASIEDIRRLLDQPNEKQPSQQQSIHYVIATDVDQIPTQYSAYTDPETDRHLQQTTARPKRKQTSSELSLWLIRGLIVGVIALLALDILSLSFLFKPLGSMHWIPTVRSWVLLGIVTLVAVLLAKRRKGPSTAPKEQLGLSSDFPKEASLDSWTDLILLLLKQLFVNPTFIWRAISSRRIGQLLPAFSGYLKRTRSLTYGYLEQRYGGQTNQSDCHLIRNMIFELASGKESDPDYAAKLITLPVSNYQHEEKLDPISPIARKVTRARYVSTLLQAYFDGGPQFNEGQQSHLMLQLLTQSDGTLLEEARAIIDELQLKKADHIWRWLCNNLACVEDDDNSCLNPECNSLNDEIQKLVNTIKKDVFATQISNNHPLFDRCLVSLDESLTSYSWIPLICEMATNVPTTLWLNGARWYTPNLYDSHQRIRSNGKWSVDMPKEEDLPDPGIKPIDLSALGKAPAAAVCTVAGYVSTCFNLLEFFYTWLGNCSHAQEGLLQLLKQEPFHFQSSEQLKEMEELPYSLRSSVWKQLNAEGGHLPKQTLDALPLLEYPLNRRNGLPESYWAGKLEE